MEAVRGWTPENGEADTSGLLSGGRGQKQVGARRGQGGRRDEAAALDARERTEGPLCRHSPSSPSLPDHPDQSDMLKTQRGGHSPLQGVSTGAQDRHPALSISEPHGRVSPP